MKAAEAVMVRSPARALIALMMEVSMMGSFYMVISMA